MRQVIKAADYSISSPSIDLSHLSFGSYNWMDVLGSMRVDMTQLVQPQYQLLQINGLIETDLDLQVQMHFFLTKCFTCIILYTAYDCLLKLSN